MKKIIIGLVLFFIITIPSKVLSDNKKIFCSSNITENDVFIVQEEDVLKYFSGDKCKEWQKKYYLSPYQFEVNEISEKEFNAKKIKQVKTPEEWREEQKKVRDAEGKLRAERLEEEHRQSRLKYLEDKYGSKCVKNKNNNNEYQKCLNEQEQIAKKNKEQEEFKLAEENKKKQLIADKQKIEREKTEAKIANMKPEERRAYICENTYGFGKGSTKFSDCVYKIMNAEVDLQKLELQKKLAEAQQETARANESAARANASRNSTPTYDPNVAAAMERTNEIERARILLNLGQALRTPVTPQSSAPVPQTNCRVARGGYINCW